MQLESRDGLVGKGKLLDAVQPGALLQERSRSIPSDLALKMGLNPSLGSDATAAKQALEGIPRMTAIPLQQQDVQYIFGRMTSVYRQQLQSTQTTNLPEVGSLGLFSPARELIPDSFGSKSETVTAAIARLHSKLNSLLAAHIIKTALNTNSSRLNVVASMQPEQGRSLLANSLTIRGGQSALGVLPNSPKLPLKTAVQLQVTNNESSELYASVLVIDPTGDISVVFPNDWATKEEVTLVRAGQTLKIPDPQ